MRNAFAASSSGKRWVISFSTEIWWSTTNRVMSAIPRSGSTRRRSPSELANELIARVDLGLARLADEGHPAELRRAVQGGVLPGGAARAVDGDVDAAAPVSSRNRSTGFSSRLLIVASAPSPVPAPTGSPECRRQSPARHAPSQRGCRPHPSGRSEHGDGIGTRHAQPRWASNCVPTMSVITAPASKLISSGSGRQFPAGTTM